MKLRLIDLADDWADRKMYLCFRRGSLPSPVERFIAHLLGKGVGARSGHLFPISLVTSRFLKQGV